MKTEAPLVRDLTLLSEGGLCESREWDIAPWPITSGRSLWQAARPRSLVGRCISRIILMNCMGRFSELNRRRVVD